MLERTTDAAWEYYGRTDPYYGVLTADEFRTANLTADAKRAFFASGERYIDTLLATVRQGLQPNFRPERALDFGCGVGRLVVPLATRSASVVGVDISPSMLVEARKNVVERGLTNVELLQSDDTLSRVTGTFDFVHSLITFQHIPPKRGVRIFERLVKALRPDGIGALHVTCGFATPVPLHRRLLMDAQERIALVNALYNLLKRQPINKPAMQMNRYSVDELLRLLQREMCHEVHVRFTETMVRGRPFYGVTLLFRKTAVDTRANA